MNKHQESKQNNDKSQEKPSLRIEPHQDSHIKHIIGVISGKGGVGKSTVTSLLATHLQQSGHKVGIIDADITGPSIPKAFNLHGHVKATDLGWFPEVSKKGIKVISINLMLEHETDPVLWRGPLISNMVKNFYKEVIWEDIDYLLVDFPPGTGDVAITMFQSLPISGVVVVTSPQDLVSMIVAKAVHMANKMQIPVLGLIENMSYFVCSKCHEKHEIFGKSHIDEVASTYHTKVLAKLPIDSTIASLFDQGEIENIDLEEINSAIKSLLKDQ